MGQTGVASYVFSQCDDDMASLSRGLPRVKSTARAEGYHDGINGHVSVTNVSIQDGRHRLWLDLERDRFRQAILRLSTQVFILVSCAVQIYISKIWSILVRKE